MIDFHKTIHGFAKHIVLESGLPVTCTSMVINCLRKDLTTEQEELCVTIQGYQEVICNITKLL